MSDLMLALTLVGFLLVLVGALALMRAASLDPAPPPMPSHDDGQCRAVRRCNLPAGHDWRAAHDFTDPEVYP